MTAQGVRAGLCLLSLPSSTTALKDPQRDPQFTHPQQGLRGEFLTPPPARPPSLTSSGSWLGSAPPAPVVGAVLGLSSVAQGSVTAGVLGGVSWGVSRGVSLSHTSSAAAPGNSEQGCSLFWGELLHPRHPLLPPYPVQTVLAAPPQLGQPRAASDPARPLPAPRH